jgi:hypothetical protein
MPGTIFRLPDNMSLQRGITYTILPDGRMLKVPSMSRIMVRAAASTHDENDDSDIVQALSNLIKGKKPQGRQRVQRGPRGQQIGGQGIGQRPEVQRVGAPPLVDRGEGLRPAIVNEM